MIPIIEVKNFSAQLGLFQLNNINLTLYEKEVFALLGRTGSGKTALLESIAGFYKGTSGSISIEGVDVEKVPLEHRGFGFVYQDLGLFPHMTVYDNISYGLKMQKKDLSYIKREVHHIAEILSIPHILNQYPGTLSGGEGQRTALARSIIMRPKVLLMDEPFSALDPSTKKAMYHEIKNIHKIFGCTILFVTHDFNEAQIMAQRVGIMIHGGLKCIIDSTALLKKHKDEEVNKFLGI